MPSPEAISFLVPIYNSGRYLMTAIESVAEQLGPDDEVLVQDGASTDGSVDDLVDRYAGAPWLKVVSEGDKGQSDALQKALERAVNPYVMWLNGDDVVYPGALAAIRRGMADGPDLVVGRSTIFNNEGRVVRTYTPRAFERRAFVGRGADLFTGSIAYRTELVRAAGGFNADYEYAMDIDMFARVSELEPSAVYINEVIAGLRWHDESKGGTTLWPIVLELHQVRMAHARTNRERAAAFGASTAYWLAGAAQPIRHSRPYSALRAQVAKRAVIQGSQAT